MKKTYLIIALFAITALSLSACDTTNRNISDDDGDHMDENMDESMDGEWTEEEMAEMSTMEGQDGQDGEMEEEMEEMMEDDKKVPAEEAATETSAEPMYVAYSETLYNELLASNTSFALFFHAGWCPTCQFMDKNITSELSSFPKGTKILKADFDTELNLRSKYGITSQSLIVIVDSEGNATETLAAPSNTELAEAIKDTL